VDLGEHAIGVLLACRLQQDQAKVKWADSYAEHDLVPREDGNPIHPERVSKQFQRLVAASGLRRTRLQDLRHARASLLLASGTDISLVPKMLGHSSIGVTVDTYSHLLEGVGRRAAEAADALVPRQPRTHSVHTEPEKQSRPLST